MRITKSKNLKNYLETLIGFLTGVSWALVIILFLKLFFSFLPFGIFYALLAGSLGFVVGLFLVVIVELFSLQIEKTKEIKKQTKLLEDILNKLSK